MTKKILFRADGSATTGLGHLYRLFSLVDSINDTLDFVFVTHETSTDSVIPKNYNKVIIPKNVKTENEPKWLSSNFSPAEFIIVADGYQFVSSYQRELKIAGFSLVYIDDFAQEHMFADLVINHSPYIQENHFRKEAYTKLALGTKYALVRSLFLKQAKQNRSIKKIDIVFVCFGGSDPFNLSLKTTQALLKIRAVLHINVVLGGAYEHKEIFRLQEENLEKISIHRNLSEVSLIEVMLKCNFAIAPASTILYELSCVKMPILSGYFVDNQELIYRGFSNNNAIYKAGNFRVFQVTDFVTAVETIIKENNFENQIAAQKNLFDDKIVKRHLNLIKNLC